MLINDAGASPPAGVIKVSGARGILPGMMSWTPAEIWLSDTPDGQTAVLPDVSTRVDRLPPYKVLLHNDDVNTFEHVILSILKLTRLTQEEAIERTVEAHERGISLLLVTHKERAELYCEQFATYQVTVTCEPDE